MGDKFLNIINQSLKQGDCPDEWTGSVIVPMEKKRCTIKWKKFGPINMVKKLLKICVNEHIKTFIKENRLLGKY